MEFVHILSDIIILNSTVLLINILGISKIISLKRLLVVPVKPTPNQ